MYIDLIVLIILILIVVMFFKRFSSFVFFMAIVDIFLRIMAFVRDNIGLGDVSSLLAKYFPSSIFSIIDKYTSGIVTTILDWIFVGIVILGILGFVADRLLRLLAKVLFKHYGITE